MLKGRLDKRGQRQHGLAAATQLCASYMLQAVLQLEQLTGFDSFIEQIGCTQLYCTLHSVHPQQHGPTCSRRVPMVV